MSSEKVEVAQPEAEVIAKDENEDVQATTKDTEMSTPEKKATNGVRTYENGMLKTSAREDEHDRNKNSKYDPSILPETNDPVLIRNQVEFYFGDSNLSGDTYMLDMTGGPTNLPIKIELLCTKFRRMVRFRPISAVVAALRESEFLEVSGPEGLEEVKRKVPYDPSIPRSKAESRSIYAKGFGDEEPSSQFDIEAFFAPYGPTNAVRLRRTPDKLFKGSVFVEFQDEETQEKFLALDPKPMWKGKHQLKIMSKKEYMDEKGQEIRDGVTQPNTSYVRGRGRGRGRGGNHRGRGDRERGDRGGRDRGDRDPNDWKKRREEDRANGFPSNRGRQNNRGGGRRDHKGPRDNDRNREREGQNGENSKKRAREDDDGGEGVSSKKVDSKPDVATESS